MDETGVIRTPDQRVRVFVSSALRELAPEREAVRDAVTRLRLVPVLFELGARPHPPRRVYRDYLAQSQVFVGVYWQTYGWVAPGEATSGLEDEYLLSAGLPRLIYVKSPAPQRDPRLAEMLNRIKDEAAVSYQQFSDAAELEHLVENDLAVLLSERFERSRDLAGAPGSAPEQEASPAPGLPVPPTPLIGREQDAAALEDLVMNEGVRLVTITGPAGIGKTRLAVEAAQRLEPRFRDGVRFADLSSVSAAGVADTIAGALPVNTSGANLSTDVQSYLRTRRLLLVLDNFEQAMEAAPLVAGLLSTAPGLVVLVTSRTLLRLRGEHDFPVPALAVPDGGSPDAEVVGRYAAVGLFVTRARAVAPGFELTSANAAAVGEICRRLDGLPLAIELAAARTKLLPPQALLARLGDPIVLLTGGPRDLPARQQTLKNTLDWSFGLLSAREQALLMRLGVFAGTFGLSAVQAVCGHGDTGAAGPDQAGQVLDALQSLADSSMVEPQARDGEPRFRLLDTIRDYALGRLRDNDAQWREAHDRHAAYYAALAEPAAAELQGPGQVAWLRRLEAEHSDLAAMMSWLSDQDPPDALVDVAWVTWRFWWLQGHADEMTRFTNNALAKVTHLVAYQRGLMLAGGAFERLVAGDHDQAEALSRQSLPLLRQAGDKLRTALAASVLGHLLALRHQDTRASALLDQSQTLIRELDVHELTATDRIYQLLNVALTYNFLGQTRLSQGDHQAAGGLFTQALSAALSASDRFTVLISLYDLAVSSRALGDLSGAAAHLAEGLSLAAEAGDETSAARYLEGLAVMATPDDNPQRAVHLLAAASALLEASGSGWLHAYLPPDTRRDDVLAALRSRLGGQAFEAAWAYGRSIKGRRAVDYALNSGQPATPGRDSSQPGPA
jgi:predicted ATPase